MAYDKYAHSPPFIVPCIRIFLCRRRGRVKDKNCIYKPFMHKIAGKLGLEKTGKGQIGVASPYQFGGGAFTKMGRNGSYLYCMVVGFAKNGAKNEIT